MKLFRATLCVLLSAILTTFVSCTDSSDNDASNNTKDIAVTGSVVDKGVTAAAVEAYFNPQLITEDYSNPEFGVEVSETKSFGDEEFYSSDKLAGRKATVIIDDLQPNTTYYYRACVRINKRSLYVGKDISSFKTNEVANVVSSFSASDIALTTATLKGQVDVKKMASALEVEDSYYVGLVYSDDKEDIDEENLNRNNHRSWSAVDLIVTEETENQTEAQKAKLDGSFSWKLTNLKPNTTYYYATFSSVYSGGKTYYKFSGIKSFNTSELKGSITLANASDIGLTSATISGTCNIDQKYLSDVSFRIEYKTSDYSYWNSVDYKLSDKTFKRTLSSLSPNTEYDYRAVISINGTDLITSDEKKFKTKALTGTVTAGNATDVTYGSAKLAATITMDAKDLAECNVCFQYRQSSTSTWRSVTPNRAQSISYTLTGLSAETTYEWRAMVSVGSSELVSTTRTFTTKAFETEAVDLGLSVLWANCDLGATSDTETGTRFQWGATTTSGSYSNSTSDISGTSMDAARALWGGTWRMPTRAEVNELISKCSRTFVNNGTRFTGPNGNSIFLPQTGGSYYWTSTPYNSSNAYRYDSSIGSYTKYSTYYIRPVKDK